MNLFKLIGLAILYREASPLIDDAKLHFRYLRQKHAAIIDKLINEAKSGQAKPLTPTEQRKVEQVIEDFQAGGR